MVAKASQQAVCITEVTQFYQKKKKIFTAKSSLITKYPKVI